MSCGQWAQGCSGPLEEVCGALLGRGILPTASVPHSSRVPAPCTSKCAHACVGPSRRATNCPSLPTVTPDSAEGPTSQGALQSWQPRAGGHPSSSFSQVPTEKPQGRELGEVLVGYTCPQLMAPRAPLVKGWERTQTQGTGGISTNCQQL